MKMTYNGKYVWHGVMLIEGHEKPFAIFADTMADAVAAFDTLPKDALVIALERGESMMKEIELDDDHPLAKAAKRQVN